MVRNRYLARRADVVRMQFLAHATRTDATRTDATRTDATRTDATSIDATSTHPFTEGSVP